MLMTTTIKLMTSSQSHHHTSRLILVSTRSVRHKQKTITSSSSTSQLTERTRTRRTRTRTINYNGVLCVVWCVCLDKHPHHTTHNRRHWQTEERVRGKCMFHTPDCLAPDAHVGSMFNK